MNLFFGLMNEFFYSNLAIPKFSYQNVFFKNPLLCKLNIVNNRWNLNLISEVKNDDGIERQLKIKYETLDNGACKVYAELV